MPTKESIEATCPECRGPLSLVTTDTLTEVSCLVGHIYSVSEVLRAHSEAQEKALWAAVVALKEATNLVNLLHDKLPANTAEALKRQAEEKWEQAVAIQRIIEHLQTFKV